MPDYASSRENLGVPETKETSESRACPDCKRTFTILEQDGKLFFPRHDNLVSRHVNSRELQRQVDGPDIEIDTPHVIEDYEPCPGSRRVTSTTSEIGE